MSFTATVLSYAISILSDYIVVNLIFADSLFLQNNETIYWLF